MFLDPILTPLSPRRCFDDTDAAGLLVGVPGVADALGVRAEDVAGLVNGGTLVPDGMSATGEAMFLAPKVAALRRNSP